MFTNIAATVDYLWIEHGTVTGVVSVYVMLLMLCLALATAGLR